jgi:hypothetical protein
LELRIFSSGVGKWSTVATKSTAANPTDNILADDNGGGGNDQGLVGATTMAATLCGVRATTITATATEAMKHTEERDKQDMAKLRLGFSQPDNIDVVFVMWCFRSNVAVRI